MDKCELCQKPVPDYEPTYCCAGGIMQECGCRGQPLEPCVCSQECYTALMNGIGKTYEQRRIDAGIEIYKPNILYKTKCYLIGNIQYHDGKNINWRDKIEEEFNKLNITCLNPLKATFINFEVEVESFQKDCLNHLQNGDYETVNKIFKRIVQRDLACVDRSDFVVAYIKPEVPTFGSIHELVVAAQQRKPTFIIIDGGYKRLPLWLCGVIDKKSYIYDSVENLIDMIRNIDNDAIKLDSKKWRLLHKHLR